MAKERLGLLRTGGLEPFEAEQDAERFAGGAIGIENMHQTVAVHERAIVDFLTHPALPNGGFNESTCVACAKY